MKQKQFTGGDGMKAYEKMKAVVFDIADSLDEVVAGKKLVPAGAGAGFGGNIKMATTFGLDSDGNITDNGNDVSLIKVS